MSRLIWGTYWLLNGEVYHEKNEMRNLQRADIKRQKQKHAYHSIISNMWNFHLNTTQSYQETDFSKELTLTKQQLKQRQNHQTNHFRSENFSSYATNPCITEKHSTRIKTSIIFSIQKQFISSKSVIDTSA